MLLRDQMQTLVNRMLDGNIMLDEAMCEFEKLYIQNALERNAKHLSRTAAALGIHRNTLSKRLSGYREEERSRKRLAARQGRAR
jgi:DNA-binding NtrC family response regulator